MVHGGTNFGFTSGANYDKKHDIQPDLTSYDYDAPVSEAGWVTPKFDSLRNVIQKYADYTLPDAPAAIPLIEIPSIKLDKVATLEGMDFKTTENNTPLTFEQLNQGYGYVAAPQESKYRIGGYREVFPDDFYSTVLTGYMDIPGDGVYYFSTDHELWIDGKPLISNEQDNRGTARKFSRSDKSAALAKGLHAFKLIRLGAIFGGFPTQWENILVAIRKEGQPDFSYMDKSCFR